MLARQTDPNQKINPPFLQMVDVIWCVADAHGALELENNF